MVGIIANPVAGKDIRRLVSAASAVSDMAKIGNVRRAVVGAIEGGASLVLIADDHKSLGRHALANLAVEVSERVEVVTGPMLGTGLDSRIMAASLRDRGVDAIVVLGGDGTHRDVVKGWRDSVLVTVSTGTNNVFTRMVEATVAGHAAAIAARANRDPVRLAAIARRAKVLDVTGYPPLRGAAGDLALIDIALVSGRFTASRAVWDPALVQELVVTTAEPDTIGLSAVAARLRPVDRADPIGLRMRFGGSTVVRAPIAPGLYRDVAIENWSAIEVGDRISLQGPGVLAFDGERDLVLDSGGAVEVTLARDGPWVVDTRLALNLGAISQEAGLMPEPRDPSN